MGRPLKMQVCLVDLYWDYLEEKNGLSDNMECHYFSKIGCLPEQPHLFHQSAFLCPQTVTNQLMR